MHSQPRCCWAIIAISFLAGMHAHAAETKIRVFVSILPQQYFVERIGGTRVDADVLVPPGQSPATYSPSLRQMARLATARAYFRIGVPFETVLLPKIRSTLPTLPIIDTCAHIRLRKMENGHTHDGHDTADTKDAHDHAEERGGLDPHTWLSPPLVMQQAVAIHDTLVRLDPAGRDEYAKNLKSFLADLATLHTELLRILAPLYGKTLLVFHPSYGYFAETYGLRQKAIELEGKAPGARYLDTLIRKAKAEGIRVIFVQPQFSTKAAKTIATAINGVVVPLDPLAKNYLENLRSIAHAVETHLRSAAPGN